MTALQARAASKAAIDKLAQNFIAKLEAKIATACKLGFFDVSDNEVGRLTANHSAEVVRYFESRGYQVDFPVGVHCTISWSAE